MLDTLLASAFGGLLVATVALLIAGRSRRNGRRLRLPLGALGLVAAALLSVGFGTAAPFAIAVGTAVVASRLPRSWNPAGAWFFAAVAVLAVVSAVALGDAALLLGDQPLGVALGLVLLIAELAAIGLIVASAFGVVQSICSVEAPAAPLPDPERWPVVCVQVPSDDHRPDVVVETIRSVAGLDYPALRIQVIDNDSRDDDGWELVEAECAAQAATGTEISFLHLPAGPGARARALNRGTKGLADDVEIVGVVDAGVLVRPDWLRRTAPAFGDPAVALVQARADFRGWRASSFSRAVIVGWLGAPGAPTIPLIRRATLDGLGGWDELAVDEDAELATRVVSHGGGSLVIEEALGRAVAPSTYEEVRRLRFGSAFAGVQVLRRDWRLILGGRGGLTVGRRVDLLAASLRRLEDGLAVILALFVVLTAIGLLAGRPFVAQRLIGLGVAIPIALIAADLLRYLWAAPIATGSSVRDGLAAMRLNLSLSWVILGGSLQAMSREHAAAPGAPGAPGGSTRRQVRLVALEATLGAIALVLAILLLVRERESGSALVVVGLLAWTAWIGGSAVSFALGDRRRAVAAAGAPETVRLDEPAGIGRVARSKPARASLGGALALVVVTGALAVESDRAPRGDLPFHDLPSEASVATATEPGASATAAPDPSAGPAASTSATPAASIDASATVPEPSTGPSTMAGSPTTSGVPTATPALTPSPGALPTPGPTPAPTPAPTPGRTPAPTPTRPPTPTPTPTVPGPTPTPIPTPTPTPTPRPHPSHSPRPHP